MVVSRILSRVPRSLFSQCRSSVFLCSRLQQHFSVLSHNFHSLQQSPDKLVGSQIYTSVLQRCRISSSASQPSGKERGSTIEDSASVHTKTSGDSKHPDQTEGCGSGDAEASDRTKETDAEDELCMDDLVKLVAEKEELLKVKQEEIKNMKDKFLRSYAEMENVMERKKREAENSKKFAIQSFAKGLLDVADTLQRASSVVGESFSKIDASKDAAGAVPLLKTLLEGVEMTDKQLAEVFRKFGVEKFDPTNEKFDPHRHNAVFQIPDGTKPPGIVAAVLKVGYVLYDRIIRPAEVGVTREMETDEAK